jgi:hypothetical protein
MNKEIKCEQLSVEWFSARLGKLTGSKFQKLMPTKRQKPDAWNDTQLSILRECAAEILTGEREESFINKTMQWGIDNEQNARRAFELQEMTAVRECGIFLYSDYIGSSPDGIIEETEETWETKCPTSKQHLRYWLDSQNLIEDYGWQAIGECFCAGYKKGIICSYDPRFPDDKMLVIHRFEPTEEEFTALKNRLELAVELIKEWIGEKPIDIKL